MKKLSGVLFKLFYEDPLTLIFLSITKHGGKTLHLAVFLLFKSCYQLLFNK